MEENTTGMSRERLLVAVAVVAAVILATVLVVIWQPNADDATEQTSTPTPTAEATTGTDADTAEGGEDMQAPIGTTVLPEAMNGQEAIDALGDRIGMVAERNGRTVAELKELLLRDDTVYVSKTGFIVFRDDFGRDG